MRKIEQQMIAAIRQGKNWQGGNTTVQAIIGGFEVQLHGNTIAHILQPPGMSESHEVRFTLAGWPTPTTRSRVNALLREFPGIAGRCFTVSQERGKQIYRTWRTSNDVDGCDVEREITATEWVQA